MGPAAISWKRIEHNKHLEPHLKHLLVGIVERGWDVNARNSSGQLALHLLARYLVEDQLMDLPEVKSFDEALNLPLDSASALAITKLFLAKGAEVDPEDCCRHTPLHHAVKNDNLKIASILLGHGANANFNHNSCRSAPLHKAESARMAELLLANGALVNAKSIDDSTPLHCAVERDNLIVASILLKYGAGVNLTCRYHIKTPLDSARSRRMAELLLTNGASVDTRHRQRSTPLHNASERNSHEVMQVLVKFGANVDAKDCWGRTALDRVVYYCSSTKEVEATIRLLARLGADITRYEDFSGIQEPFTPEEDDYVLAVAPIAQHQSVRTDTRGESLTSMEELIAASIALDAAGLSWTRDNFRALDGGEYDSTKLARRNRSDRFSRGEQRFKLECKAKVERLKNHMLTETMSVHAFMLTDNVHCVSSKSLPDTSRVIDFEAYPTYEYFLMSKSEKFDFMVSAMDPFSVLLESGANNVWSLPGELVARILVYLDIVDLCNVIICGHNLIERRYVKRRLEDAARPNKAKAMRTSGQLEQIVPSAEC